MLSAFHEDVNAGLFPTRALTLRNPWPWFMFHVPEPHRKRVENRSRNLGFHREFWVHCSANDTREDWAAAAEAFARAGVPQQHAPDIEAVAKTNGKIVARVVCAGRLRPGGEHQFEDVGPTALGGAALVTWQARAERLTDGAKSAWYFGKWGYVIESFELVTPVACAGALGFWRVPLGVLEQLGGAK